MFFCYTIVLRGTNKESASPRLSPGETLSPLSTIFNRRETGMPLLGLPFLTAWQSYHFSPVPPNIPQSFNPPKAPSSTSSPPPGMEWCSGCNVARVGTQFLASAIAIGTANGFDKSSCLHGYSDSALFFLAELLDLLLLPLPQCVYETHHPWRGILDSYVSCHNACFEVSAKIVLSPEYYNFVAEF